MIRRYSLLVLCLAVLGGAGCGGDGDSGGGGGPSHLLYTLFTDTFDPVMTPPNSEVVITDVDTMTDVGGFPLPGAWGASLAVSPDGQRLYIADRKAGKILVRSPAGVDLGSTTLAGVYDVVLDAAGDRLWAATFVGPTIARFDAITLVAGPSLTATGMSGGISLSPDGSRIAWPSSTATGGTIDGCYLVDASTLASPTPVPFTGAACAQVLNDTRFVSDARLVVWDSGCDTLHQVDVPTNAFLPASEVALPSDPGASFNFNNCLASVPSTSRVYGFKESAQVFRIDPFTLSSNLPTGLTGTPFLVVPTADATSLLVLSLANPVTIDRMDLASEVVTPDVHTFTTTMYYPRDAKVLIVP